MGTSPSGEEGTSRHGRGFSAGQWQSRNEHPNFLSPGPVHVSCIRWEKNQTKTVFILMRLMEKGVGNFYPIGREAGMFASLHIGPDWRQFCEGREWMSQGFDLSRCIA